MTNIAPTQTDITSTLDNYEGQPTLSAVTGRSVRLSDSIFSQGFSDVDGSLGGIAITSIAQNAVLWYSLNDGNTWTQVAGVSATNALLLNNLSTTRLYYQNASSNPDYNGDNGQIFTYRAWDQTSGTIGGFGDTSTNGGASAFSAVERVVLGTTTDVNDAPTLSLTTAIKSSNNTAAGVGLFTGASVAGGNGDTFSNSQIRKFTFTIKGIVDIANEFLVFDGKDIPLGSAVLSAVSLTGNLGGMTYTVSASPGGNRSVTISSSEANGWSTTGADSNVEALINSIAYKNTSTTLTQGLREIGISGMLDTGTKATLSNPYLGNNAATISLSQTTSKVMVDTTAPATPSTAATVAENDNGGISTAEAEDGTVVAVSLLSGTGATAPVTGDKVTVTVDGTPVTYNLTEQDITNHSANVLVSKDVLTAAGQGPASVSFTITDAAGNVSAPSPTTTINIDTVAPTAPVLALGTGVDNGATVAEAAAGVVLVTAEAGANTVVTFTNGAHSVSVPVVGTGAAQPVVLTPAQLATLGDGLISVSAVATDAVGNPSPQATTTFTLDTVAPAAPTAPTTYVDNIGPVQSNNSAAGTTTDDTKPGINVGTGLTGTITLYDGNNTVVPATYDPIAGTLTPDAALAQGTHAFTYTLTDAAGNESAHSTPALALTINTAPPATPSSAPASYNDNVGSITNAASTAPATDDTTPGIQVGTGLTDTPKLYDVSTGTPINIPATSVHDKK